MHDSLRSPILKLLMADLRARFFGLLVADFTVDVVLLCIFFLLFSPWLRAVSETTLREIHS